jgi:hypothetical protein
MEEVANMKLTPKYRSIGVMDCWIIGLLDFWSDGLLGYSASIH